MRFKEEFEKVTPIEVSTFVIELVATGREEEVKDNFAELFLKCDSMFKGSFIKNIMNIKGIEVAVANNFEIIIENISSRDITNFIRKFIEFQPIKDKVIQNFDVIINKCRDDYLVDLLKVLKQCAGVEEILNNKLEVIEKRIDSNDVVGFIQYMNEIGKGEEIEENFEAWYNKSSKKNLLSFVKVMKCIDGAEEKLKGHFTEILRDSTSGNLYSILKEMMHMIDKQEIVHNLDIIVSNLNSEQLVEIWEKIKDIQDSSEKLKNVFKERLDCEEERKLVETIDNMKEIDIIQVEIKNNIGDIINRLGEDNERQMLVNLLLKSKNIAPDVNKYLGTGLELENAKVSFINQIIWIDKTIQDVPTKHAIYSVLKEVIKHENVKIEEVNNCGMGENAKVFEIGEFVWKFQENRATNKLIYDPRILQPIVRKAIYDYENGVKKEKPSMYIQMSNKVDIEWYEKLTQEEINEELYKIYKEMRDRGIIWTDVKADNVGRLLKDNKVNYKIGGNDLNVEDETIEMYGRNRNNKNESENILKKGELVILDEDYIYTEKEYKKVKELGEFSEEDLICNIFEKRYEAEKEIER